MTDTEAETLALLGLVRAGHGMHGVSPATIAATVERVGSARTVLAGDFDARGLRETRVRTVARGTGPDAPAELAAELAAWRRAGLRLVTVLDEDYPAGRRAVAGHPPVLWYRGALTGADAGAVAVVGTRAPSPAGWRDARRFATALAEAGVTVVSGLAAGIDTAAHAGALAAGGRTLAVLAHGLARPVYPGANAALAEQIAGAGALVTAYAPHTAPVREAFRERNLVTAGLARAALIVEARAQSGSQMLARLAAEQRRTVLLTAELAEREPWARELATRGAVVVGDPHDLMAQLRDARDTVPAPRASPGGGTPTQLRLAH